MPSCRRVRQLEVCDPDVFGNMVVTCQTTDMVPVPQVKPVVFEDCGKGLGQWYGVSRRSTANAINPCEYDGEKRRVSVLVDQLLSEIYSSVGINTDYNSGTSSKSLGRFTIDEKTLCDKGVDELYSLIDSLKERILREGRGNLLRHLKRRDALRRQREARCQLITDQLRKLAPGNTNMRFTIEPEPGESGFSQWVAAMKMVAQLPGGIPPEFRYRLWLQLAEKFLASRGVDWPSVERTCFSEWSHPADAELGVQIVKDLHRTGCSLFCGEDGQENQALLKRVLLAYARWNKAVGYCQGFNMLAALILQVTEKNESDALKLMIFLIEGVLPESYFADSLRGLSVDMAVFRELLKSKLPRLSRHLDALQTAAKDGTTSYEPPLTNVFTMQWFLTLFCNCLPQPTVLRVWDLIFLEGNEMLLRTALAIWQTLAERILHVRSADEFYCIMGVLTREMLEFGLVEPNSLVKAVVTIGPLPELRALREHFFYNINPWSSISSSGAGYESKQVKVYPRERLMLDISALKKQYAKLKQRQRQAHIIISAAVSRQPPPSAPVAMNHLLLGKSALVPARRLGPPKGSIPPARQPVRPSQAKEPPKSPPSTSSSDTELCDDPGASSSEEDLPVDNLQPPASDKAITLMNTDNTVNGATSASSKFSSNNKSDSDIFDTASTSEIKRELVDDEDFNFERFLEERVRCLKHDDSLEKAAEIKESGRKNSQRAMDIIQENSIILQRILQCQSRLTPSPPLEQDKAAQQEELEVGLDTYALFSPTEDVYLATCNADTWKASFANEAKPNDPLFPGVNENGESRTIESLNSPGPSYSQPCYVSKWSNIETTWTTEEKNEVTTNSALAFCKISDDSSYPTSSIAEKLSEFCLERDDVSSYKDIEVKVEGLVHTDFDVFPKSPEDLKDSTDCFSNFSTELQERLDDLTESETQGSRLDTSAPTSQEFLGKLDDNVLDDTNSTNQERLLCYPDINDSSPEPIVKVHEAELKSDVESSESVGTESSSKYSSIFEYSKNLDEKYNSLILNSPLSNINKSSSTAGPAKSPNKYLLDSETSRTNPELKSPTKSYNPFPVRLSSRQSKDVGMRLGLYKK